MAELKKLPDLEVNLVKGSGGVFEVTLDGALIFSKKATGRFPELQEVLAKLPA